MRPRFLIHLNVLELIKIFFSKSNVRIFEKKFSRHFKLKFPLSFSYGRSAIFCFFKAMGIEKKEIIMPAYTCSVVAHAVTISGNNPRFLDVNFDTFNFDNKDLLKNINKNTAAIILTNTFGVAQNVQEIKKIIKIYEKKFRSKIYIIQDCCHSFDAKYENEKITKYGDIILFSFNISKTITSIFGAITTFNDKKIYQKVKEYRDKNFFKKNTFAKLKRLIYIFLATIFFNQKLYFITYFLQKKTNFLKSLTDDHHLDEKISFPNDYNTLLCDLEAKVGLNQILKYNQIKSKKIKISKFYSNFFKKNKKIKVLKFNVNNTYSHYPVIVKNKSKVIKIFEKEGIEIGEVIQYSIPDLKPYKNLKRSKNSSFLSKHVINLPNEYKIPEKILKKFESI
jgi:perosamine synthetase